MYPDYNMNNIYYGFNEFDYRGDYSYRNANQLNMYSDEIITLNQAIELIRQSVMMRQMSILGKYLSNAIRVILFLEIFQAESRFQRIWKKTVFHKIL